MPRAHSERSLGTRTESYVLFTEVPPPIYLSFIKSAHLVLFNRVKIKSIRGCSEHFIQMKSLNPYITQYCYVHFTSRKTSSKW